MTELTPVYFDPTNGEPQYFIDIQNLIHCLGNSGQAGLIKITGFQDPRLRLQLSAEDFSNAQKCFHDALHCLKDKSIIRKEDLIYFHNQNENTAIVFLSKKRDTNYYLMKEMDILLYRIFDFFITELSSKQRLMVSWQNTFSVTGSFHLIDPMHPMGDFITKAIQDAENNVVYHQKKFSVRQQELLNYAMIHDQINPVYHEVFDINTKKPMWTYATAKFISDVPWMQNSWSAFLSSIYEGLEIELDHYSHIHCLKAFGEEDVTPLVLTFCPPWSHNILQRQKFLRLLSHLTTSFPQKKLFSFPLVDEAYLKTFLIDFELYNIYPDIVLYLDSINYHLKLEALSHPLVKALEIKKDLFDSIKVHPDRIQFLKLVVDYAFKNQCEILVQGLESEQDLTLAKSIGFTCATGYYFKSRFK